MRNRFAQLCLNRSVSEQAQGPAGTTRGRSRASQGGNLGSLRAVNADGTTTARLVKEGGLESIAEIAALDVEDGLERDVQGGRDGLRMLTAVQEVKNASAGLRSGSRRPAGDDGCQRAQFVLG